MTVSEDEIPKRQIGRLIALELGGKNSLTAGTVLLVITTVALAWMFSNSIYALHYAHLFYGEDKSTTNEGQLLRFPGTEEPNYWDFMYFSLTLGMTFQTSDVEINNSEVRKVVLAHSLAAFVFNLGVIAFTVNILGGA